MKNKIMKLLNIIDSQDITPIKQNLNRLLLSPSQIKMAEQIFGNFRLVHNQFVNLRKNNLYSLCNLTHLINDFRTIDYLDTIDSYIIETVTEYVPEYTKHLRKKSKIQFALCKSEDMNIHLSDEYFLLVKVDKEYFMFC